MMRLCHSQVIIITISRLVNSIHVKLQVIIMTGKLFCSFMKLKAENNINMDASHLLKFTVKGI